MSFSLASSDPRFDLERRRARRLLAGLALLVVVLLAAVAVLALKLAHRSTSDAAASPGTASTGGRPSVSPSPDVSFVDVAGVALPVSRLHGPRVTDGGRAAGYSRSEQGAALAAVQVLVRTSATSGPRVYKPVLASQVTGVNTGAMSVVLDQQYDQLRARAEVPDGDPVPGNDATVDGYLLPAYDGRRGAATVAVVLSSASLGTSGQYVRFDVSLLWTDDDWRVVAPPRGDWGTVSTILASPLAGLLDYRAAA